MVKTTAQAKTGEREHILVAIASLMHVPKVIVCLVLEKPPGDLERSSVHYPHRWFLEAEAAMTPESPSCGREDFRLPGAQVLRQQLQEHRLPPTAPTALGAVQGPLCNLRSPGPVLDRQAPLM